MNGILLLSLLAAPFVSATEVTITTVVPVCPKRPRVALVLGGGGLRGVAQIGIIKVLQREKIPIDLVVGTSMGAIIGGLFCAGVDMNELEEKLVKRFIAIYYPSPLSIQALKMPISLLLLHRPQGLYGGNRLAKAINKRVGLQKSEISSLSPEFAAVATDLIAGKTYVITHGDLGKALQASSAIPILRTPVVFDDALLVDGGTICNLPVHEAKELGADFVIAVDVDEKLKYIDRSIFKRSLGGIASRVLGLLLAKLDESPKAEADICIQPDVTGISLLSKRESDGDLALLAGEKAAEAALPELKRRLALAGIATEGPQ